MPRCAFLRAARRGLRRINSDDLVELHPHVRDSSDGNLKMQVDDFECITAVNCICVGFYLEMLHGRKPGSGPRGRTISPAPTPRQSSTPRRSRPPLSFACCPRTGYRPKPGRSVDSQKAPLAISYPYPSTSDNSQKCSVNIFKPDPQA